MADSHDSFTTLTLAYDGALATITLNRPDKRNALKARPAQSKARPITHGPTDGVQSAAGKPVRVTD